MNGFLKKIKFRWVALFLLLLYVWIVMSVPAMGEWYARHLYPFISFILSRISFLLPFSVGDVFIYGSIAGLLVYWGYALVKRRSWKRTLGHSIEYLLWVYVWFYLSWGLNYFRENFFSRTGTVYVEYSPEQFKQFLTVYTDSLNSSFVAFDKIDESLVSAEIKDGYNMMDRRFGLNRPAAYLRAKPMLIPPLMSGVGVLGYMGPFFNEYNLNPRLLPVQYPFTYAHEMAHVLGISSEAEANLYAYLVCTQSKIPEIRFSGYFGLLSYVLENAYMLLSEDEFNQWRESISPEIRELYNRKVTFWQAQYSPFIGELQDTLYNWFLKGNNIPTGRKNYSEVVALLMALNK